jgi:hydrogenase small subunit
MNRTTQHDVPSTQELLLPPVGRRKFLKAILQAAAAVGLSATAGRQIAEAVERGVRPSVIWLHFQECTGCSESLLRTSHPDIAALILENISLDYHETLMAASGLQAEETLKQAMKANAGRYILVVEGAIPTKLDGQYMKIGGKTGINMLKDVASSAALVVAIGSCASWGGIPSADPNPTGAVGVPEILKDKKVATLPGCPANPYILLGTVFQFAVMGTLPELDEKGRPKFAYGRTIHEHCPRRAHFDAGRFATKFGDQGHRLGYCLYKLGCKGPSTHANCSTSHFCEVVDAWPIGLGHPCFGCTEKDIAFRVPLFSTTNIDRPTPPDTYPEVNPSQGDISAWATGAAGLVAGALLGGSYMTAKYLGSIEKAADQNSPVAAEPGKTEEKKP